jgi:hypothetical protein
MMLLESSMSDATSSDRLGWKGLSKDKHSSLFSAASVTKKKSFKRLLHGVGDTAVVAQAHGGIDGATQVTVLKHFK